MKPAFDITSVLLTLRKGVEKGYWTVEQLDQPSNGWKMNARAFALHYPKYQQPQYRNLLRDEPTPTERVEIVSPRDFAVAQAPANHIQRGSAPLSVGTNGAMAEPLSHEGVQGRQGSVGDEAHHGDEAHLGTAWEGSASGVGDVSDDW